MLEEIYDSLLQELPLADNAPGGMIKYRRSLTLRFDINSLTIKKYKLTKRTANNSNYVLVCFLKDLCISRRNYQKTFQI